MTRWYLEGCLDETKTPRKTPLTKFPFKIGRSKRIDMVVLRTGISRKHAEIYKHEDRLYIRDLGSTNGTFVDNVKVVGETELTHNCLINFAHVESRLIDTEYREPDNEPVTVIMTLDEFNAEANARVTRIEENQEAKPTPTKTASNEVKDDLSFLDLNETSDSVSTNAPQRSNKENLEPEIMGLIANQQEAEAEEKKETLDSEDEPNIAGKPVPARSAKIQTSDRNIFVQGRWDKDNRRKHARRESRWHAKLTLKSQQIIPCSTRDVSQEGMSVLCPINLKENTILKIDIDAFYNGKQKKLTSLGIVKHTTMATEGFTVGIFFTHVTKDSSEFLCKYASHDI